MNFLAIVMSAITVGVFPAVGKFSDYGSYVGSLSLIFFNSVFMEWVIVTIFANAELYVVEPQIRATVMAVVFQALSLGRTSVFVTTEIWKKGEGDTNDKSAALLYSLL